MRARCRPGLLAWARLAVVRLAVSTHIRILNMVVSCVELYCVLVFAAALVVGRRRFVVVVVEPTHSVLSWFVFGDIARMTADSRRLEPTCKCLFIFWFLGDIARLTADSRRLEATCKCLFIFWFLGDTAGLTANSRRLETTCECPSSSGGSRYRFDTFCCRDKLRGAWWPTCH